jgi:hypothetical protein
MEQWRWYPPEQGFALSAGVLAGFGVTMWWFWLTRLGTAAPAKTRRRVVAFFALGAPPIVVAAAVAWWLGLELAHFHLFTVLHLDF